MIEEQVMEFIDKKAPSTKKDLLTVIWESWNNFDLEYWFKLVKSMLERIKALIKAQEKVTK